MPRLVKTSKRPNRSERGRSVLISLVETYLKTRKPVGSQTLQEAQFQDLSSATLRNHFAELEEAGLIKQQHASGGRIPETAAYAEYARYCYELFTKDKPKRSSKTTSQEEPVTTNDIIPLLEHQAETLSRTVKAAVAITSPRFDHDAATAVRFIYVDIQRCLCIVQTEFGLVHTSLIAAPFPLSLALLRQADRFSRSRLFNEKTAELSEYSEEELSHIRFLYQEAMARYFVSYSAVSEQDLWRTGFSRLTHMQVESVEDISSMVSLLENTNAIRGLAKEAIRSGELRFWVGDDLSMYLQGKPCCSVIAMPYRISGKPAGALVILCPMQVFYLPMFRCIRDCATQLSELLTKVLVRHKIGYRLAESGPFPGHDLQQVAIDFYKNPLLTYSGSL